MATNRHALAALAGHPVTCRWCLGSVTAEEFAPVTDGPLHLECVRPYRRARAIALVCLALLTVCLWA